MVQKRIEFMVVEKVRTSFDIKACNRSLEEITYPSTSKDG